MAKIREELKAYRAFVNSTEKLINSKIKTSAAESISLNKRAHKGYADFKKQHASMMAIYNEMTGYLTEKSGSTSNKELLNKQLLPLFKGTKSANAVAKLLYGNIEFKANSVLKKKFDKKYNSAAKFQKVLVGLTQKRAKMTLALNKATADFHQSATLGAAVFKARYFISGSLLNHSSMSGVNGRIDAKLAAARSFIADLSDSEKTKYTKRIEQVVAVYDVLRQDCQRLGGEADVIDGANEEIEYLADWDTYGATLDTLGVRMRSLGPAMMKGERHPIAVNTLAMRDKLPLIAKELEPDDLVPPAGATEISDEEAERAAWIQATRSFPMAVRPLGREIVAFRDFLANNDHFTDWNGDQKVTRLFNSYITDAHNAYLEANNRLKALNRAYKTEDLTQYQEAHSHLASHISVMERAVATTLRKLNSAGQAHAQFSTPDDDPTEVEELLLNVSNLGTEIRNQSDSILAQLRVL